MRLEGDCRDWVPAGPVYPRLASNPEIQGRVLWIDEPDNSPLSGQVKERVDRLRNAVFCMGLETQIGSTGGQLVGSGGGPGIGQIASALTCRYSRSLDC